MNKFTILVCFLCLCKFTYSENKSEKGKSSKNTDSSVCPTGPDGGVKWIEHVMQPDFGWKEHTHRAVIALAVNKWRSVTSAAKAQIILQLEVEITRALTRNSTSLMHENDLALYINALIACNKNPRDFHGIDLVSDLLYRITPSRYRSSIQVSHPFLVLTLCNAGVLELHHIRNIMNLYTQKDAVTRQAIELKALSLKALACAMSLKMSIQTKEQLSKAIHLASSYLIEKQLKDGSFGNPFTTALVFQALIACGVDWEREDDALKYLEVQSKIEINMVKAYYIEMALRSKEVRFIKDLSNNTKSEDAPNSMNHMAIKYSVVADLNLYYTVTLSVPSNSSFFDVLKIVQDKNKQFNFTYYENENKEPVVYSVSGIPNDPEENMFWRLCVKVNQPSHQITFTESPAKLRPSPNAHITYWYRNADCPGQ